MSGEAASDPVVRIERLCKTFGHRRALSDVSLDILPGRTLALLGHNGAGKTTLMRCLVGLARPTSGSIQLWGRSIRDPGICGRLGLVAHQSMVYSHLTVVENLRFFAAQYGIAHDGRRIDDLVEDFGLAAHADQPASALSRGLLQRLSLARSVVHDPDLLVLDEPWTGLDQAACRVLSEQIMRWQTQGKTIILTTHQTELGLACCTDVAVLASGRLLMTATRDTIDVMAFCEDYIGYANTATGWSGGSR